MKKDKNINRYTAQPFDFLDLVENISFPNQKLN